MVDLAFALPLVVTCTTGLAGDAGDPDSDRDGLSDFQERHKYFTDPKKADSDGDGIGDGDWEERREYAYTVRTIVQVLPPVTPDVLCDDQQDARILEQRGEYVEMEVVHYPLNTVADAIVADPDWRKHVAAHKELKRCLEPGITANWTPTMRDELIAALAADGIDVAKLDDKSLVEQASRWLFSHTKYADGFTTYCSTFDGEGRKARVLPGLEEAAERGKNENGLTIDEQWERELFAEGMWRHRMHGSCTSSAIFVNGCLRALGIPTRIVLFMPLVDGSDEREVGWLTTRLTHHKVRKVVRNAIEPLGQTWANHTYNEVWVGGRWRRLNYSKLGQGILDPDCFGLMTHIATFDDWSDGEMAKTWGLRQNRERGPEDPFGGSNPYSCIALSDRFGPHSKVDNPRPPEHRTLTIGELYWLRSPRCKVGVTLRGRDPACLFLAHVRECFADEGLSQYADFDRLADKHFVLRRDGEPDVPVIAEQGYWLDAKSDVHEFLFRLASADLARLTPDVEWTLVPRNANSEYRWAVEDGVTLVRDASLLAEGEAEDLEDGGPEQPSAPAAEGERVLTIDRIAWSDDVDLPDFIHEQIGDPPRLLGHVAQWSDFEEIRELTTHGDRRFFLEAEGHSTLKIGVNTGGITLRDGTRASAWVILPLGPADWAGLEKGVQYSLRPQNSTKGYRWLVATDVKVPPRS